MLEVIKYSIHQIHGDSRRRLDIRQLLEVRRLQLKVLMQRLKERLRALYVYQETLILI
jgi:hypothetical protein